MRLGARVAATVVFLPCAAAAVLAQEAPAAYAEARQFAAKWCVSCHGPRDPEAGLDLTALSVPAADAVLLRAAQRIRAREMPPAEAPQPSPDAIAAILRRLDEHARDVARNAHPRVTIRRLSRYEYQNTIRDLLGIEAPADDFPVDDAGYGFDNIGDVLGVSPLLFEKYAAAAERIAGEAIVVEEDGKPRRERVDARAMQCSLKDSFRGSFRMLYSSGQVNAPVTVRRDGEYLLRARVYGDQAGPEPVRLAFFTDGRRTERVEVKATREAPVEVETRVRLARGARGVGLAFLNDYYDKDNPDPKNRDRNLAVEWVEIVGPTDQVVLPPSHRAIFAHDPGRGDASARIRSILKPLILRAWRRPARPEELARLTALARGAQSGERIERGVQVALQAILTSPHFLFRAEADPPANKDDAPRALDGFELATRLAYFLWSSTPDERLLAAAPAITEPVALQHEAARMLGDARAAALAENFASQWLELRNLADSAPDVQKHPAFDEDLRDAMRRETEMLFEAVLREGRPVRDLVAADFTFVNERLARHYGIPGVRGPHMRRVAAPAARGGGVIAHASILTVTSNATRTSPVLRGKWVLDRLLDAPPPAPPPGVGALVERAPGAPATSVRHRLEQHRTDSSCASCHARIDAIGFLFERFDPIGAVRATDDGAAIDDTATLPDGRKLAGLDGVRTLAAEDGVLARSLAKKLFVYGIGRPPGIDDEAAIQTMLAALPEDPTLRDVVLGVAGLEAFRRR